MFGHCSLRQEHKAGEKMFVDRAGTTIPVYDCQNGPSLAGAVRGHARREQYTFAECTRDQQMESWLRMHVPAFEHSRGRK
jgi:hypothetical protein